MKYEIKRTNRKTIAISIVDGQVIVRAPHHASIKVIEDFLRAKEKWITQKVALYRPVGIDVDTMNSVRVFGVIRLLRLEKGPRFSITLGNELVITVPDGTASSLVNKRIDTFLKNLLVEHLSKAVPYYATCLNLKTPSFKVRKYRRLYGRCTQKHELSFNTYLYHDTLDFINYVVLHECAHILEFNHSHRFYAHISSVMPNYKEIIAQNKTSRVAHPDQ